MVVDAHQCIGMSDEAFALQFEILRLPSTANSFLSIANCLNRMLARIVKTFDAHLVLDSTLEYSCTAHKPLVPLLFPKIVCLLSCRYPSGYLPLQPSLTDGCLFDSGHLRLAADTFKHYGSTAAFSCPCGIKRLHFLPDWSEPCG